MSNSQCQYLEKAVLIAISITLLMSDRCYILYICSEKDLNFALKFKVVMTWMEHRLEYHDLHDDSMDNLINSWTSERLWVPPLIFKNTNDRPTTTFKEDGSTSLVVIKKVTGSILTQFVPIKKNPVDCLITSNSSSCPILIFSGFLPLHVC